MDASSGRKVIVTIIAATLGLSVIVIAVSSLVGASVNPAQQAVRFALTALMSYFLYRGARWARWVAIVLFLLGGLGGLLGGIALASESLYGLAVVGTGIVYLVSAGLLLFNGSVKQHFSESRAAA